MDSAELDRRFDYHPPITDEKRRTHEQVRQSCKALAVDLNWRLPDGREKALAMTALEEAMFWANAAVARQG